MDQQTIEPTKLHIKIISPKETILEDIVLSVSSVNVAGKFDILPEHANFITLISKYVIIDTGKQTEQQFDIDKGILYAMSNKVSVYVGI